MIASDGAKVEVKNAPTWTPPAAVPSNTTSGTDNTNSNAGTGNTSGTTQNTGDSGSTSSGSTSTGSTSSGENNSGSNNSGGTSSGTGQGSGSSTGSGSTGGGTPNPPAPTETPTHTHNYSVTVVAPTCTTAGNSYRDNETSALGHDWVEHSGQICIRSEQHTFCGECGMDLTAAGLIGAAASEHSEAHVLAGGGGRTYSKTVPVEWEDYTEYTCSRCGAVK